MLKPIRTDWYFVIPASLIWISALVVTAWDFIQLQKAFYRFQYASLVGAGLSAIGLAVRVVARRSLRQQFSCALRVLDKHRLIKHGLYGFVRHPAYAGDLLFWFGVTL